MKTSNYIQLFQNIGKEMPMWNSVFLVIKELSDKGLDEVIQTACVKLGQDIDVDGVVGKGTVTAIFKCDPIEYLQIIGEILNGDTQNDTASKGSNLKHVIMSYLGKVEGMHLHWNRTEKDFTTMYGVYAYSFPSSAPVQYVRELARKKGLPISRHTIRRLDRSLTPTERQELKDLIYKFYLSNFMDEKINNMIGVKSALSFFSNSVNGGMERGYKSLQYAIGFRNKQLDGKFGKISFKRLSNTKLSDVDMNQQMGNYMYGFYLRLARRAKFRIYLKGWINRLIGLGWKRDLV